MITNTVNELNMSNDYFTANIEVVEFDIHLQLLFLHLLN